MNALEGHGQGGSVETVLGKVMNGGPAIEGPVVVGIRNEGLALGETGTPATVENARVLGPYSVVDLLVNGEIRLTAHIPGTRPPSVGDAVNVEFDRSQALFSPKSH